MNLCIGKNIRKLRGEKGVTQEVAANHLGISFQAISKWERGEGYPDITMLPALANYFGVTVDELIGMEEIASAEKLEKFNKQWAVNRQEGRHAENVTLMQEVLRIFPNEPILLVQLSASLERLDGTAEERRENLRRNNHTEFDTKPWNN